MDTLTQSLSRRAVLSGLGASIAAPAFAAAPMANVQAPAIYRFKLGGFECTVVSDGPIGLGPIKAEMFKGYTQERIDELLAEISDDQADWLAATLAAYRSNWEKDA